MISISDPLPERNRSNFIDSGLFRHQSKVTNENRTSDNFISYFQSPISIILSYAVSSACRKESFVTNTIYVFQSGESFTFAQLNIRSISDLLLFHLNRICLTFSWNHIDVFSISFALINDFWEKCAFRACERFCMMDRGLLIIKLELTNPRSMRYEQLIRHDR